MDGLNLWGPFGRNLSGGVASSLPASLPNVAHTAFVLTLCSSHVDLLPALRFSSRLLALQDFGTSSSCLGHSLCIPFFVEWLRVCLAMWGLCLHCSVHIPVRVSGFSSCHTRGLSCSGIRGLSFPSRDRTHVSCVARWILTHWTTRKLPLFVFWTVKESDSVSSPVCFFATPWTEEPGRLQPHGL